MHAYRTPLDTFTYDIRIYIQHGPSGHPDSVSENATLQPSTLPLCPDPSISMARRAFFPRVLSHDIPNIPNIAQTVLAAGTRRIGPPSHGASRPHT